MIKLIRDKYDEVIPEDELEICTDPEVLRTFLEAKLAEEITELMDSNFKDVDEYADVLEVLFTLGSFNDITKEEMQSRRVKKLYEKGGFSKGLILKR